MSDDSKQCVSAVNANALKSEIRARVINQKANACPMTVRLAWHASGTFDKSDNSGGSDGATMRFEPESTDGANAGLGIMRDMLLPIKQAHPELSFADLWVAAGANAIEFCGGPAIEYGFGRTDGDASGCPANGRLPDATQGAQHLRDVFYRMGFNDQEIVALSGAHTLGSCHRVRSGFDGPWTQDPLKFDNTYFTNLLNLEWQKREWDGPLQFEDKATKTMMMLPSDMALVEDAEFKKWVEKYAADEALFFTDFAAAYAKLLSNGCPVSCKKANDAAKDVSAKFRDAAMHGSLPHVKLYAPNADVHARESTSGRTALHKAAFWGHEDTCEFLINDCKIDVNVIDYNGDSALHDAARFGHAGVVKILLAAGANASITNKEGQDVKAVATAYEKPEIVALL